MSRDDGVVVYLDFVTPEAAPQKKQLPMCPKCGGVSSARPHSVRWKDGRKVDCVGDEVKP